MSPIVHARLSAKKYGGKPECYLEIHNFLDSTKSAMADIRHRAILHNSFGCFIAEKIFGTVIVNSDGKEVPVRSIAEDHIVEDIGFIPSIEKWLSGIPHEPWMAGGVAKYRKESLPQPISQEKQILID
jgi:hypothetical protein